MSRTDESALIALSLEYADAVRTLDAERWAATWTEDARWILDADVEGGRDVVGRDAIVEMWRTAIAKYSHVVQIYQACTFDIDGDVATGRCEFQELNMVADGTRKTLAGHYTDTYRRVVVPGVDSDVADGWRFTSRHLTKYYQGPPDLTGSFPGA